MKKYAHLREKARELRHQGATLTEICEQLALGKSTVHGWIKDIPIPQTARQTGQRLRASHAISQKHATLREQWYNEAYAEAGNVLQDARLRDFVVLYAAEGFKRATDYSHAEVECGGVKRATMAVSAWRGIHRSWRHSLAVHDARVDGLSATNLVEHR